MKIKQAELIAMAVRAEQYPAAGPPEIAFAGRSNVGKSSLLNIITNRKSLARVSGSPGKTRTINFYSINGDEFRIVDLPGYGYARVAKSVSGQWGEMIERYLVQRGALKAVCLLLDIRREPTGQDRRLYGFLESNNIPACIVVTKADKVSANGCAKQLSIIRKTLGIAGGEKIVCVSALKRKGIDEMLDMLEMIIGRT